MLGMLVTDGVNGLWISRLIRRADEIARIASRVMGLAVAAVSLLVGGLRRRKLLVPASRPGATAGNCSSAALVAVIAGSFLSRCAWRAPGGGGLKISSCRSRKLLFLQHALAC